MNKPEVAFVTPGSFAVPSTGSSSVEHAVAELAGALAKAGPFRVTVFGIRVPGSRSREMADGVYYRRPGGRRNYLSAVISCLRKKRYAVIQVENRPRHARRIKRAFPHTPVWLSMHSLTFAEEKRIRRPVLEACFRSADLILVNSRFLRDELARRVPSQAHKLRVNHLGANVEQFVSRWSEEGRALRERLLAEHGLEGRRILLFVGRLIRIKGVHRLLKAMPLIAGRYPDAVLVIVGSAYYNSRRTTGYTRLLHRLARVLSPGRVRFVPFVPHNRIQEWFVLADAAVVPSCNKEAFGLVNVEAMASGIPVIAARAGGMTEIVEHGVTGWLLEEAGLEEAVAAAAGWLLEDGMLCRQMGEAGRCRVLEHFTWPAAALRWLELAAEQGAGACQPMPGNGSGLSDAMI